MAIRHELEVVIKPDGTLTFGVKDGKGPGCLDLTRELEESLGVVVEREKRPEFYLEEETEREQVKLEE